MKRKFKVYYPEGHEKAGQRFKVGKHKTITMTDTGFFMVVSAPSPYDMYCTSLAKVIDGGVFSVKWSGQ